MEALLQKLRQKFKNVRMARGSDGHVEYRICCPYCPSRGHTPDRKYHMWIHSSTGQLKCWRCSYKGNVRQLVSDIDNLLAGPAIAPTTAALTSAEVLGRIPPPYAESGGGLIPIDRLDPEHPAILYLTKTRKRPFNPHELARDFGVSYCNKGRIFAAGGARFDTTNTLIFPVYWQHPKKFGEQVVIGWQARLLYNPDDLSDTECAEREFARGEEGEWLRPPKYLTNPGLKKGRMLYNYVNARAYDYVVVTEGVFDVFSTGLCAVALFGKMPTKSQLALLMNCWKDVILLLDPGDASGEMEDILDNLSREAGCRVTLVTLKGTKDAGDTPRKDIWRQIIAQRDLDQKQLAAALQGVAGAGTN